MGRMNLVHFSLYFAKSAIFYNCAIFCVILCWCDLRGTEVYYIGAMRKKLAKYVVKVPLPNIVVLTNTSKRYMGV